MAFVDDPTARNWYRAHNASVVAGYLEHRDLAEAESEAERFFMNVVLCRVSFTHALVAAPRLSLGWVGPVAPFLGDPRLGMTGIFLLAVAGAARRVSAPRRSRDLPRHRARLRTTPRLRGDQSAAAAGLRVVGARVGARRGCSSASHDGVRRTRGRTRNATCGVRQTPTSARPGGAYGASTRTGRRPPWPTTPEAKKTTTHPVGAAHLVNPPAKVAVWTGLVPGFVLVETTGRKSGDDDCNVVGMRTRATPVG